MADRQLSDDLFFLPLWAWGEKEAAPIVEKIFPLDSSLWQSYSHGEELGEGGCGLVKLGSVDGKPTAIKKGSRVSMNSFYVACEAAVMKALDHPNIVRFHCAVAWLMHVYIAMEYMDGGDLSELMMRRSCCDESLIAIVMREVLKGLVYMHGKNYAHCDIKPENIFLSRSGEVKIGDLGCAKDVRVGDRVKLRGTELFMPPESQNGICSTARDIWALALTAIDLFTGELPFEDDPSESARYYHSTKSSPPVPKNISTEFKEFLTLALQNDWKKRATAQDLLDLPFIKDAPPTSALIPMIPTKKFYSF